MASPREANLAAVQGVDMVGGKNIILVLVPAAKVERALPANLARAILGILRHPAVNLVRVPAAKVERALPANLARAVLGILRHPAVALIPPLHEVGVVVAIPVAKVGKEGGIYVLLSRNSPVLQRTE